MKRIIALGMAFALLFCLTSIVSTRNGMALDLLNEDSDPSSVPSDEVDGIVELNMGTGQGIGSYYAFGTVLANAINACSSDLLKVIVVSSGGTIGNISSLASGEYQLALLQSDSASYAFNGVRSYAENDPVRGLRAIASLYSEAVQIVAPDPEIQTVTDLRGRKVVIGVEGSSVNYIALDIFNAYDMEAGKDFEPVFDSFGASMEKLQTGEIDAAIIIAGIPTNAIVTFRSSVPLHLVSIDDEHLAKLQEDYPYFAPFTIGAEVYNTVKDAQTVALKCILAADASLSEDLVYTTTAAIFSQLDMITGTPKGSELNLASATKGVGLPFHPGAAKYYAEQGFTVNTGE